MKRILIGLLVFIIVGFLLFVPAQLERSMNTVVPHQAYPVSERARQLHESLIIGDWHADSTLWQRDLAKKSGRGHVDLPRLRAGNVALQVFTTVTKSPSGLNYQRNASDARDDITLLALTQRWPSATWLSLTERALYQAHKLHHLQANADNDFLIVRSKQDLTEFLARRNANPNLVGGLIGTEGSHALDGELANIRVLFDAGFRVMSLQHFFDNRLGGSLHGTSQAGLTEFGHFAIKQMQDLGIIVDVSHSSEQTVRDVLAISTKPLLVSHTGFKGHCNSARNISDKLMQDIAADGGLIGVGYWAGAICGTSPTVIAEAILYGVALVGADHISLGSDFDGTVETGIDTAELIAITQALIDQGASDEIIRKVMGENMLRVLFDQLPDR